MKRLTKVILYNASRRESVLNARIQELEAEGYEFQETYLEGLIFSKLVRPKHYETGRS